MFGFSISIGIGSNKKAVAVPATKSFLLLETGSYLLLETGYKIYLE